MVRSNKRSKKMKWGGDLSDSGKTDVESNSNPAMGVPVEPDTPPVGVPVEPNMPPVDAAQGAAPKTSWFSMPSLSSLNPFSKNTEDLASEITAAQAQVEKDKAVLADLIKQKSETQVITGGRRRSKKTKRSKRSNKKRTNKRHHR